MENRVTGVRTRTDRRSLEAIGPNTNGSHQTDRGYVTQRSKNAGEKSPRRGLDNSGNIEGSYVSCQDTHVLEQTVQVARHIRCIVLRSSTEVASHRSQRIGATWWHVLCNMGIVFAGFFHAQSVRLSLPHVNEDMRPAHHVPPPVQPGTPVHPLTSALSKSCRAAT
jgi:hypothetical protein